MGEVNCHGEEGSERGRGSNNERRYQRGDVGEKVLNNRMKSNSLAPIWVSIISLTDKHGIDMSGKSLPSSGLGVLMGVTPISIAHPPFKWHSSSTNITLSSSSSCDSNFVPRSISITDSESGSSSHSSSNTNLKICSYTKESSVADIWRAAGFSYGEEEQSILQAQVR